MYNNNIKLYGNQWHDIQDFPRGVGDALGDAPILYFVTIPVKPHEIQKQIACKIHHYINNTTGFFLVFMSFQLLWSSSTTGEKP